MLKVDEGNALLARMIGRVKSTNVEGIDIRPHRGAPAVRKEVAASLSRAMMNGDIQGVVAALSRLGVRPQLHDMRHR